MTMKVVVETDNCIASGACVLECPEVFDQDDDGLVVLLTDSPGEQLHAGVRSAAAACPAAVILIEE
jgi:ferredoxin